MTIPGAAALPLANIRLDLDGLRRRNTGQPLDGGAVLPRCSGYEGMKVSP